MRRTSAMLGSALFLVLAPGSIAGLIPRWISGWAFGSRTQSGYLPLQIAGAALIAAGLLVLLDSFIRFAVKGLGTPAPVFPTRHLVVTGLYRFVRNPIYVAVVAMIAGQGLFFANVSLLEYAAGVWLFFQLVVIGYEEPTLQAAFGAEYEHFFSSVPRWIPRIKPVK